MEKSEIVKFLDKIREEHISEHEMTSFIKDYSDNYDERLLKGMIKEVEDYLIINKSVAEINLTDKQKQTALKKRKESGLPIPYLDITEGMSVQKRESTERLLVKRNIKPLIDWERLLYPYDFIDIYKFKSLISDNKEITSKEEHSNIFSKNGFTLFEYLLDNYIKKNRGRYSDISYYYWKMYNDKIIHQRPEPFKKWFSDTYEEELSKIKTLEEVKTPDRNKHYSNALDWFNQQ